MAVQIKEKKRVDRKLPEWRAALIWPSKQLSRSEVEGRDQVHGRVDLIQSTRVTIYFFPHVGIV